MVRWQGYCAVLGGFLIQLTLGSFYSFGNMMTYMTSYMRKNGNPDITYGDFIIVQSVWGMTQGITFPLSGLIIRLIGDKPAMIGGCVIFSCGAALTYFTIDHSLATVALTYGFISAFGQGIALIPTLTIGMRWFPQDKGKTMGIVVGGFGGGALIFNYIQTSILNPDNIPIDNADGPDNGYFTDPDLLDRVPTLMLILGVIYLSMSVLASCLITIPPDNLYDDEDSLKNKIIGKSRKSPTNNVHEESKTKEKSTMAVYDGNANKMSVELTAVDKQHHDLEFDDTEKRNALKAEEANENSNDECILPFEALKTVEFYILWLTRLFIVMITQTVAGFYKAYGQTFIRDDHFLSTVGSISALFNCSGRLLYGSMMDRVKSYKITMCIEACLLLILLSSYVIPSSDFMDARIPIPENMNNETTIFDNKQMEDDDDGTRYIGHDYRPYLFAAWTWLIFLTFPGTFAIQPAVSVQTFGIKYGGTVYGFLITSDILNNLLVGVCSKWVLSTWGFAGLWLIMAVSAALALTVTIFYPKHPQPKDVRVIKFCDKLSKFRNSSDEYTLDRTAPL